MNTAKRMRTTTGWLTTLSLLPHIFCCFIPTAAAIMALGSTVGLGASLAGNPFYQFVDAWHPYLLMLAVGSVAIAVISNLVAWRIDCHTPTTLNHNHGCEHGDCTPKKRTSLKLLYISLALLVLDVAWFLTESKVLHLHNHGHVTGDSSQH
jgi:hypothetical protein